MKQDQTAESCYNRSRTLGNVLSKKQLAVYMAFSRTSSLLCSLIFFLKIPYALFIIFCLLYQHFSIFPSLLSTSNYLPHSKPYSIFPNS